MDLDGEQGHFSCIVFGFVKTGIPKNVYGDGPLFHCSTEFIIAMITQYSKGILQCVNSINEKISYSNAISVDSTKLASARSICFVYIIVTYFKPKFSQRLSFTVSNKGLVHKAGYIRSLEEGKNS